jgi:hypothetical protein
LTCRRTTDSASVPGGLVPGPGGGETPLPVANMIRPDPSDTRPLPDCQMPASALEWPASVDQSADICAVVVFTPAT